MHQGAKQAVRGAIMAMAGAVSTGMVGGAAMAQSQPIEWKSSDGGNGHWYAFHPRVTGRNWHGWRSLSEAAGAHLATVTSGGENTFITQTVLASAPVVCGFGGAHAYLGGYQDPGSPEPTGGWKWVTGEPFVLDATRWFSLEDCCGGSYCDGDGEDTIAIVGKNGECTTGLLNVGLWNDVGKCLDWWGAVYEWSADCDQNGLVDYGEIARGEKADANGNNIPDCCEGASVCPCAGDADENGFVDAIDLAIVLARWGTVPKDYPRADTDSDGIVNAEDLAAVLGAWGPCGG